MPSRISFPSSLVVLLFWLLLPAAPLTAAVEVTDAYGDTISISQPPRRVVSLAPGVTDMLVALGVKEALQGVTYFDRLASDTGKPAAVGGFFAPSLAAIQQCRPDCIFLEKIHQDVLAHFRRAGIPVLQLPAAGIKDILANLRLLGAIFQRQDKAAELGTRLQSQLEIIRQKTAHIPASRKLRVIRLMSDREMLVPGDDSFQNDYIRHAGGIPPTLNKIGGVVPISLPEWRRFNPQAIFFCGADLGRMQKLLRRPGWQEVEAVRQGRLYQFPCDLTCRASVRAGDFITWLAATLYTQDFADDSHLLRSEEILAIKPLTLHLPYVRQTRVITSRIWDFEHKSLLIDFTAPVSILSTLEGPRQGILRVGNHSTPPPCWSIAHHLGLDRDRNHIYRVLKQTPQDTSFLFTGADMDNLSIQQATFKDFRVYALVTAGVESNALRLSQEEGRFYEAGTINIILLTNYQLTPRAMSRAVIAATEAKTAALQDLDVRSAEHPLAYQATGTGTDNLIVVGGQGSPLDHVGGHSKMGELIGKAVYQAVREAVARQNGISGPRPHWQRLQERRLSLYDLVRHLPEISQGQVLSLWESEMFKRRYAGFMETALALSDAYDRGQVRDLQAFADWCKLVAQELAGEPITVWRTINLEEGELPLPIKMACEAFINGLAARARR